MMNSKHTTPNQADIARALDISPATVTKCKHMGMPVDSVPAARAWRTANIAPTMHNYYKRNTAPGPTGALQDALALMDVVAAALASGQSIGALVPVLRLALHAVPKHERDPDTMLQREVMHVLVADVLALMPPQGAMNDDGSPAWCDGADMSDDEAAELGKFWYQVAAGEIGINTPKARK